MFAVIGELKQEGVGVPGVTGVTACSVTGSVSDDCDLLSLPNTPIDEPDTNFLEVFTDLSAQIAQVSHMLKIIEKRKRK